MERVREREREREKERDRERERESKRERKRVSDQRNMVHTQGVKVFLPQFDHLNSGKNAEIMGILVRMGHWPRPIWFQGWL